jgi:hypothetical protein
MAYQYRITCNGAIGNVTDDYPGEQWSKAADMVDERGGIATLYRRLITDADIMELLADSTGWMVLKGRAIEPWQTLAQMEG